MRGVTNTAFAALILVFLTIGPTELVNGIPGPCDELVPPPMSDPHDLCNGIDIDGSEMSNKERQSILDLLNHMRRSINNKCKFGGQKAQPGFFGEISWNCNYEKDVLFVCDDASASSTPRVWRRKLIKQQGTRTAMFFHEMPKYDEIMIPDGVIDSGDPEIDSTVRLFADSNVKEIGCYRRTCDDYEYMACKTDEPVLQISQNATEYDTMNQVNDASCRQHFGKGAAATDKICPSGTRIYSNPISYDSVTTPKPTTRGPTTTEETTTTTTVTTTTQREEVELRTITAFVLAARSSNIGMPWEVIVIGLFVIGLDYL